MSFGDYLWNEPCARCQAKRDAAAIANLKNTYLTAADVNTEYYRILSKSIARSVSQGHPLRALDAYRRV